MSRWTSKAPVALGAVLGASGVAVAASRTWVSGRVDDTAVGGSLVTATGAELVPAVGLALVVAAAAVAAVTVGPRLRLPTLAVGALAALWGGALTLGVGLEPATHLAPVAAASVGRTGPVAVTATANGWPYAALAGWLVSILALGAGLAGRTRWAAPSARFERDDATTAGSRGERVASAWDRLSAGDDPTAEDFDPGPGPRGHAGG